jgi:prepilin-type N-terminal cleavage/methylation domain-containing protein
MKPLNQKGFSILEIIFAIALLSLVAITVNVSFSRDNFPSYAALLRVMTDIKYAQQMATISGQTYGFRTLTNHSYEVYKGAPGTPATDPLTQSALTIDLATNYQGSTFAGTYQIEFGSGGSPNLGGGADYTIQGPGVTRIFHVEAKTGILRRL